MLKEKEGETTFEIGRKEGKEGELEEEGRGGSGLRLNGRIEGGYLVHQENGWKRIRICKFRRRKRERE